MLIFRSSNFDHTEYSNISNTGWISRSTSLQEKLKRPRSSMPIFVKRNYIRIMFTRNKMDCRTQKSQSNNSVNCPILLKLIHLGKRMWKARKPSLGKTSIIMCLGRMALFASYMTSVVTSSRGPWPHSWGLVVLVIWTIFNDFWICTDDPQVKLLALTSLHRGRISVLSAAMFWYTVDL